MFVPRPTSLKDSDTQQRLSVYIDERSERVGTIVYDPARPSVSQFCYADSWLSQPNGFAVSPELPLPSQWFFLNDAERNIPFPFAFADTEPDSWGRRLIKRSFRKAGHSRGLSEIDFLLGVGKQPATVVAGFATITFVMSH